MVPDGLLQRPQESGTYPEPVEFSTHPQTASIYKHFNIIYD
jgi:hypothetical protein